ncbi:hypothetical protein GC194_09310 [bacterium]|nr:hypothetical protein [bacterium]
MRFRNIPDQEVAKRIKAGNHEILPVLFERNLVSCLNLGIKAEADEKTVHNLLAHSVVICWQYFASKSWLASKHKIDFIIEYIFRVLLKEKYALQGLKLKFQFSEFDGLLEAFTNEIPHTTNQVINNFKVLGENTKSILWMTFFEKRSDEDMATQLGKSEDKIIQMRAKGFAKWVNLLCTNLNYKINQELFTTHLHTFIGYYTGTLGKDKMLAFELERSHNAQIAKEYEEFLLLVSTLAAYRRQTLVEYVLKNASMKLTGNIWGNKISIVSAVFIALMGLLVWYTKQHPPQNHQTEKLSTDTIKEEPIDTTIQ